MAAKLKLGKGLVMGDLDEETRPKAESRFYSYYQLHMEPSQDAQGPASFS